MLYANDFILFSFLDRRNRSTPWRAKRKESRKAFNLSTRYWGDNDFRHVKPKTPHAYRQTFYSIKMDPKKLQKVESKIYKNELSYFLDEVRVKKREWELDGRTRVLKKENASKNFSTDPYLMRMGTASGELPAKLRVEGTLRDKKIILTGGVPTEPRAAFYRLNDKNSPNRSMAGVLQKSLKLKFLREALQKQNLGATSGDPELTLAKAMVRTVGQPKFKNLKVLNPSVKWLGKRSALKLKYRTAEPSKIYLKNYKKAKRIKSAGGALKLKSTGPKATLQEKGGGSDDSRLDKTTGQKIAWGDHPVNMKFQRHSVNSKSKFAD